MTEFIDAQQNALDYPDTFEAPDLSMLQVTVVPGDYVKVATDNERFWVAVVEVIDGFIKARVANELVRQEFHLGETISFQHKHIYMLDNDPGNFADGEEDNLASVCSACNEG